MDVDVVEPVAGEPVDLVDDAIRHLVGGDVVEHPFQVGSVGGAGGFSGVDELRHNPRTQRFGFPTVSFALCGDRESFIAAALRGLFLGRDALVRHRRESGSLLNFGWSCWE